MVSITTLSLASGVYVHDATVSQVVLISRQGRAVRFFSSEIAVGEVEKEPEVNSPLTSIAKQLQNAWSSTDSNIDLAQLLAACWEFESLMKRTKGMGAVAADFQSNLRMVEAAINKFGSIEPTMTLRDLLETEMNSGCHTSKDNGTIQLHESSAAMGLLWIRRNLSFQHAIYSNTFEKEMNFPDAVRQAYRSELETFLPRIFRKVFAFGIKMVVPTSSSVFIAKLKEIFVEEATPGHRYRDEDVIQDIRQLVRAMRPLLSRWKQVSQDLGLETAKEIYC